MVFQDYLAHLPFISLNYDIFCVSCYCTCKLLCRGSNVFRFNLITLILCMFINRHIVYNVCYK